MRIDLRDISSQSLMCITEFVLFSLLSGFKHTENSLEKVQTKRMSGIIKTIIFHVIHILLSFATLSLDFF